VQTLNSRFIAFFAGLALLSLAGTVVLLRSVEDQRADAVAINLAGAQSRRAEPARKGC
jgi:hypothetical protein